MVRKRRYSVRFSREVEVIIIANEDRSGHWELYARDRERFKRRCLTLEELMGQVFDQTHREMIYNERFQ